MHNCLLSSLVAGTVLVSGGLLPGSGQFNPGPQVQIESKDTVLHRELLNPSLVRQVAHRTGRVETDVAVKIAQAVAPPASRQARAAQIATQLNTSLSTPKPGDITFALDGCDLWFFKYECWREGGQSKCAWIAVAWVDFSTPGQAC